MRGENTKLSAVEAFYKVVQGTRHTRSGAHTLHPQWKVAAVISTMLE